MSLENDLNALRTKMGEGTVKQIFDFAVTLVSSDYKIDSAGKPKLHPTLSVYDPTTYDKFNDVCSQQHYYGLPYGKHRLAEYPPTAVEAWHQRRMPPLQHEVDVLDRAKQLKPLIEQMLDGGYRPDGLLELLATFRTGSLGIIVETPFEVKDLEWRGPVGGINRHLDQGFAEFLTRVEEVAKNMQPAPQLYKLCAELVADEKFKQLLTLARSDGMEFQSLDALFDYVQGKEPLQSSARTIQGGIVRTGLQNALTGVLCYTDNPPEKIKEFAEYVMANLFEKLDKAQVPARA